MEPATHQSKQISSYFRFADRKYDIGFGFDPVSDNYKLVILSENLRFAMVYHSNSDNWIEISVSDNVFDNIRGVHSTSSVTIVKDCPYWSFCRYTKERYLTATAVKFDAGRNEFKLLPELFCDRKGFSGGEIGLWWHRGFLAVRLCFMIVVSFAVMIAKRIRLICSLIHLLQLQLIRE
nr:PREDICTED: F-box/kelch-repeat protein At3g06240-like isoform X1 [Daucus carota subsp. sativus]